MSTIPIEPRPELKAPLSDIQSRPCPTLPAVLADGRFGFDVLCATPDCVTIIAPDGTLVFMSDIGMELMGIDDWSKVAGRPWSSLWPQESRPLVARALAEARHGRLARFSALCPTLDGLAKWWDVAVRRIAGADAGEPYLLAVSRDVTAQKQIEQSLRTSEQRFRALADNISQLAWMADRSVDVFWYNQRWYDYTGMSAEAMAGQGWRQVHHPDHIDRVVRKVTASFAAGEVWEDVFPLRGADGKYRWFLSRAMPVRDDNGEVVLWCGTNTDVTEQRLTNQRLRQLARILEMSHEATVIWEPGHGIVTWNHGCEELYGFSKSEALGRHTHDLLKTRHHTDSANFERDLLREGMWTGELLHVTRAGSEVWVDSRHEVMRLGGRTFVLETNRDITERKRADDERLLLVAELNHRVRNTLAIVQSIAKQSSRTAVDVRQFVKAFKGRLQSLSSAHNVLTETHWSGAWLRALLASQLAIVTDASDAVRLVGDDIFVSPQVALQLTPVIYELATNAVRFGALSKDGGQVTVAWNLQPSCDPATQRQLHLTWTERGGPEVLHPPTLHGFGTTLIERSGRLPHFTTRIAYPRSGLVCSIAMVLPAAQERPPAMFDPRKGGAACVSGLGGGRAADGASRKRCRVLLVSAEPFEMMAIDEGLSEAGYLTVGPAVSPREAMEAIGATKFDLALVDLDLVGVADDVLPRLAERGVAVVPYGSARTLPVGSTALVKPLRLQQVIAALERDRCAPTPATAPG